MGLAAAHILKSAGPCLPLGTLSSVLLNVGPRKQHVGPMGFYLAIWEPHPSRKTPPTFPPVRGGSESSHRTCQSSGVLLGRTGPCGQVPEHRPLAAAWTSAKSSHQEGSPGAAKVGEHQDRLVSSRPHCPASRPSAHLRDHSVETAQPVLCRDYHVPRLGFLGSLC